MVPSALPSVSDGNRGNSSENLVALKPEDARNLTFELLREPNRVDRLSQLLALLRRVTPENWRAVMDAFTRQTAFEGREHGEEWKLMLQQVGAAVGPEAVLDALNSNGHNREHRARNTFEGWVMKDPKGAMAWFFEQSVDHQKVLLGATIYGLARVAPAQALDYALIQQDPDIRGWAVTELVNGALQEGGFRKGEELLAAALNRPDFDEGAKRKLFGELASKRVTMARVRNQPMDSLQWLDGYLGERSPADAKAVERIVASAAAHDPSATLQWLEERADRLNSAQTIPAYTAALQAMQKTSPADYTAWLNAHPSHPVSQKMVGNQGRGPSGTFDPAAVSQ